VTVMQVGVDHNQNLSLIESICQGAVNRELAVSVARRSNRYTQYDLDDLEEQADNYTLRR